MSEFSAGIQGFNFMLSQLAVAGSLGLVVAEKFDAEQPRFPAVKPRS